MHLRRVSTGTAQRPLQIPFHTLVGRAVRLTLTVRECVDVHWDTPSPSHPTETAEVGIRALRDTFTSASFLAELWVSSPQKLFTFII